MTKEDIALERKVVVDLPFLSVKFKSFVEWSHVVLVLDGVARIVSVKHLFIGFLDHFLDQISHSELSQDRLLKKFVNRSGLWVKLVILEHGKKLVLFLWGCILSILAITL